MKKVEEAVKKAIQDASITRDTGPESSFAPTGDISAPSATQETSTVPKKTPLVLDPDDPKTNPWTVMDTLKAIEAEESLKQDKINMLKERKSMAKTLDEQMSIEGIRERQRKKEDDDYLAQQQRMLNEWKREQQFADTIIHEKNVQMRKVRQEQMDEKKARLNKVKEDDRAKELRDIEQCKRELRKEKDEMLKVKISERKRLDAIKVANLEREKMLEKKRQEDVAYEMRLAAEYIAKVDREEVRVSDELSTRAFGGSSTVSDKILYNLYSANI